MDDLIGDAVVLLRGLSQDERDLIAVGWVALGAVWLTARAMRAGWRGGGRVIASIRPKPCEAAKAALDLIAADTAVAISPTELRSGPLVVDVSSGKVLRRSETYAMSSSCSILSPCLSSSLTNVATPVVADVGANLRPWERDLVIDAARTRIGQLEERRRQAILDHEAQALRRG